MRVGGRLGKEEKKEVERERKTVREIKRGKPGKTGR